MATADAVVRQRLLAQIGHPAFKNARRLALYLVAELIRAFIPPLDTGFFANNADFLRVHRAAVDCAGPQRTDGAVVIFHQHKGIIFQRSAGFDEALTCAH